jgi:hypothetical protein
MQLQLAIKSRHVRFQIVGRPAYLILNCRMAADRVKSLKGRNN